MLLYLVGLLFSSNISVCFINLMDFSKASILTGDDTLKLWDMRNFKKPLKVRENLISYYTV